MPVPDAQGKTPPIGFSSEASELFMAASHAIFKLNKTLARKLRVYAARPDKLDDPKVEASIEGWIAAELREAEREGHHAFAVALRNLAAYLFWYYHRMSHYYIEQLAEKFDLPTFNDLEENGGWENVADAEDYAVKELWAEKRRENDEDEELDDDQLEAKYPDEFEKVREEAGMAQSDEDYRRWKRAIEAALDYLFERHGLEMREETTEEGSVVILEPAKSWGDAAKAVIETISGVGYFSFANVREFLESGPYTTKQAVLAHLDSISRYPEVYGDRSLRSVYENAMGW